MSVNADAKGNNAKPPLPSKTHYSANRQEDEPATVSLVQPEQEIVKQQQQQQMKSKQTDHNKHVKRECRSFCHRQHWRKEEERRKNDLFFASLQKYKFVRIVIVTAYIP